MRSSDRARLPGRSGFLLALVLLSASSVVLAREHRRTGEQTLAGLIGDRRRGTPLDCLDPHWVRSTQVVPGTAIVYDLGDRLLVQRPQAGAGTLRSDDVLVSRVDGGQFCRLDAATLVEPATRMQRGFVVLDSFVPYRR